MERVRVICIECRRAYSTVIVGPMPDYVWCADCKMNSGVPEARKEEEKGD